MHHRTHLFSVANSLTLFPCLHVCCWVYWLIKKCEILWELCNCAAWRTEEKWGRWGTSSRLKIAASGSESAHVCTHNIVHSYMAKRSYNDAKWKRKSLPTFFYSFLTHRNNFLANFAWHFSFVPCFCAIFARAMLGNSFSKKSILQQYSFPLCCIHFRL